MHTVWPASPAARNRFVVAHRGPRELHDPWRPGNVFVEDEPSLDDSSVRTLVILLTGRECPWRCTMCDLWQQTTQEDTPPGAIPAQIGEAVARFEAAGAINVKLYNAGSFFDSRAVPMSDYAGVAACVGRFDRVIVESHPALVGSRVDRFQHALMRLRRGRTNTPALEVAMGLETAHPAALEQLNKRMDVRAFSTAAEYLRRRNVALRVFLLIAPPFIPAGEQDAWLCQSLDVALDCGASTISLIPTRGGNGTMEALAREGRFTPPTAEMIERSVALARAHVAGRALVLQDPWTAA